MHCLILSMVICHTNHWWAVKHLVTFSLFGAVSKDEESAKPHVSVNRWEQVYMEVCVVPWDQSATRPAPEASQHELHQCAVLPQPAAGCCLRPGTTTLWWVWTPRKNTVFYVRALFVLFFLTVAVEMRILGELISAFCSLSELDKKKKKTVFIFIKSILYPAVVIQTGC